VAEVGVEIVHRRSILATTFLRAAVLAAPGANADANRHRASITIQTTVTPSMRSPRRRSGWRCSMGRTMLFLPTREDRQLAGEGLIPEREVQEFGSFVHLGVFIVNLI